MRDSSVKKIKSKHYDFVLEIITYVGILWNMGLLDNANLGGLAPKPNGGLTTEGRPVWKYGGQEVWGKTMRSAEGEEKSSDMEKNDSFKTVKICLTQSLSNAEPQRSS